MVYIKDFKVFNKAVTDDVITLAVMKEESCPWVKNVDTIQNTEIELEYSNQARVSKHGKFCSSILVVLECSLFVDDLYNQDCVILYTNDNITHDNVTEITFKSDKSFKFDANIYGASMCLSEENFPSNNDDTHIQGRDKIY